MCGPTKHPTQPAAAIATTSPPSTGGGWFDNGILLFPLHPSIAVVAMAYLLPSWCFLNRGFTVWFHLASILQVLTQSKFLVRVLALTGASICLGWYASLAYEFLYHGRWCHALYKNMPTVLVQQMIPDGEGSSGALDFESTTSLVAMAICHVLDFLGHPLLAYYFCNKSREQEQQQQEQEQQRSRQQTTPDDSKTEGTIRSVSSSLEWPVILSSYCFSRLWSLVHTHHNFGQAGLFYFGFDVYVIDDLDSWYPAYIVESLFYGALVVWKLTRNTTKQRQIQRQ